MGSRKEKESYEMTPVFYVAKSLAGNSVVSALKASFTEPSVENVVQLVDAGTRIVISEVVHDSLSPLLSLKLNGRASTLLRIPPGPQGGSLDHILFLTEKYQLCQIVCDASRRLSTRTLFSSETLKDRTGCTAEGGHVLLLDPGNRCVAAHLYQGLLKVLPMFSPARDSVSDFVPLATLESDANINDSKGKGKGVPRAPLEGELRSPFNVSLSQLSILSLVFLYCDAHPLLAILHQDIAGQRHLVTYFLVIDRSGVTLKSAMLGLSELDSGANILIPVPLSSGSSFVVLCVLSYL